MIIEFEKRIASIVKHLADEKQSASVNEKEVARLEGSLAEAEHLYAFYRSQMIDKDRIKPHQYREG